MMSKVLLVASRWNSIAHGVDGGSMTALNVMESLKGKAVCDVLISREMAGSIPPGMFRRIHTYSAESCSMNNDKFSIRREQAIIVGEIIGRLIREYDRIVILHIFHAFFLPGAITEDDLKKIRLFPMFLSPSYAKSGEEVPGWYIESEHGALSRITSIITPSEFEKSQLTNDFNVAQRYIKVIPRIIGDAFKPPRRESMPHESLRLSCVSSFRKQKRVMLAVNLVKELKKSNVRLRLDIAGSVQDQQEYSNFKSAFAEAELTDEINHVECMSPTEISALYLEADFNVSFSNCETFGRSIVESLCIGLPNIILDESGNLQSLIGINHGAIFCKTIEEMGERILEFWEDKSNYRRLANEASAYGENFKTKNLETILADAILDSNDDREQQY